VTEEVVTYCIGEKVVYPYQGIASVEEIRLIECGNGPAPFYVMRIEATGSVVMVPVDGAGAIGLRPPIGNKACERLVRFLAAEFVAPTTKWKDRRKEFVEKTHAGDVFDLADVLKKLTYLDSIRSLGFADKRMLERARQLVIAEVAIASPRSETEAETVVDKALATACTNHALDRPISPAAAVV
jgi:CarD family transcriptional regulator